MERSETVLVTGGSGFLGMRIVLHLLQIGYHVRTTVRSLDSKNKLIQTLRSNGITSFERLSFAETELTRDDNWDSAMKGCTYVLSVASPVFFETPKDENEAIRPAVEGIRRVLTFAKNADVRRVVMTSNFGAVGFSHTDKTIETTEEDWTDVNLKGFSVYEKSKTLAERAAWDFTKSEGGDLEFATINPVAILGPSLDAHISGSFHLLENLLNGSMKAVPNIPLNVVDVRDVADLHIRAMIHPDANGQRFIASADGQISMPEIASLLKSKRPNASELVSTRKLPNWLLSLASFVNNQAREGAMLLNINRNVSNAKAKAILGWKPIATQEQAILAAVDSMVKYCILK
ncbi:SDR family oxidoreductase [Spirosoma endbachense]|uniref:NAD-dependent epimerase/dehydratase family protein n=1 Tax=Spirosoma endbachense TaxID=2666025 RepID=A0A6P1W842_9BACT|nr:aldehyde reductase [Spirosoma endbachense]QHW00081.1 NAD-dependent epimerase/dehydratase family protein [Spirosoma endbachense]